MIHITDKKYVTVKEYATERHISQQTVYAKISRNAEKLKSHVFKQNGKMYLDETAQELLKPESGNVQLVDKVKRLEAEIPNTTRGAYGEKGDYTLFMPKCITDLRDAFWHF